MSSLRSYIREVLLETRFHQMAKPKFTDLKQALKDSRFLDADPEGDGLDDEDWSSEAAELLQKDLTTYFDSRFGKGYMNIIVKVDMGATDPSAGYDAVLKDATYFFNEKHNLQIMLASIEGGPTLRVLGPVHQKVFEVISHELLHWQQFMKYSRGNPTVTKWNAFMKDYSDKGGATGMGKDYFFYDKPDGASELETFAFQMANELVFSMGKQSAIQLLRLQRPDFETLRKKSASFRDIEKKSPGALGRKELRDMLKRAKEYVKDMKEHS